MFKRHILPEKFHLAPKGIYVLCPQARLLYLFLDNVQALIKQDC